MSAIDVINYYSPWINGTIDYYSSELKAINRAKGINGDFKKFAEFYKIAINVLYDYLINDYYLQTTEYFDTVIEEQLGVFNKNIIDYKETFASILKHRNRYELDFSKYPTVKGLITEYVQEKLAEYEFASVINQMINGI